MIEKHPDTEMAKFAQFCETNLLRNRSRDYPPSKDEVIACLVSMGNLYICVVILHVVCLSVCMSACTCMCVSVSAHIPKPALVTRLTTLHIP